MEGPRFAFGAASIDGAVVLHGPRTDIPAITQACDLAVLASHEEGFPNVLLEAMACGKPIVATAVGGSTESVLDGETGLLVAPRDPRGLAAALGRLLGSESTRRRMGEAGRRRVRTAFPQSRVIERHIRLYRRLAP